MRRVTLLLALIAVVGAARPVRAQEENVSLKPLAPGVPKDLPQLATNQFAAVRLIIYG